MRSALRLFVITAAAMLLCGPALARHYHYGATQSHAPASHGQSGSGPATANGPNTAPQQATDTAGSVDKSGAGPKAGDGKADVDAKDFSHSERSNGPHPELQSNPIDSSITVTQGLRHDRRDKWRLSEKPKTKGMPGYSQKYSAFLALHGGRPGDKHREDRNAVGALVKHDDHGFRHWNRNAVGALIEHDKHDHDAKTGPSGGQSPLGSSSGSRPTVTPAAPVSPATAAASTRLDPPAAQIVRTSPQSIGGVGSKPQQLRTAAAIGGPAQPRAGVLSGNMFHPKQR
jgi:hypothetical protein